MIVTASSGNRKLGPVAATYRPVGPTCPRGCPLLPENAKAKELQTGEREPKCYAAQGRVSGIAQRSADVERDLDQAKAAPLIRHMVSGDWLKPTADNRRITDRELLRAVIAWHKRPSQRFTEGWGYTHAPEQLAAAGFGPGTWPKGFELLASCHDLERAAALQADGWRTARLVKRGDSRRLAPGEKFCPYDAAKAAGVALENRTSCASCRMCLPGRKSNIVFIEL